MNPLLFREGKQYIIDDLMEIFDVYDRFDIKNIIESLTNVGILRMSQSYEDIELLLSDVVFDENIKNNSSFYFFKYVGAVQIKDKYTILVYPKYIDAEKMKLDSNSNYNKFKLIMDVIERYDRKKIQNMSTVPELEKNEENLLGISLSILKDFYENGLYQKENEQIVLNGEGRILWNQTVNRSEAYMVNNTPFYLDLYTKSYVTDQKDLVTLIQSIIITEISRNLDTILDILDMEKVNLIETTLDEIGNTEFILNILEKELNVQFVSKKQDIIKDLIKYITQNTDEFNEEITLVGTKEFNLIWEDICKQIYGNNLNNTFLETGLKAPASNDLNDELKSFIEKPKWDVLDYGEFISGSTLKLDVLSINNNNINIYDAKYYNIQFEGNKISGQPGISDITKQYLYELVFREVIELNNLKVTNQFIMPMDEFKEDNKIVAYIKLNIFLDLGLQPIGVVLRDCETMYKQYLFMY
ncbi:LlaJI family restriction endonuclease [Mammaliicoccus sciuri]|uniref:LlaJI family restriction endonuclease n=1 Tax=Mammaliicoccus sciuri TaxID=1296 RepID=UPI000D1E37B4|nr:LlaJI family restriction endonuclease [Mammaliicoccus sciuri]PTK02305.1 hypothetical protein BUZ87_05105 [Mammaliicoccus sciuri]